MPQINLFHTPSALVPGCGQSAGCILLTKLAISTEAFDDDDDSKEDFEELDHNTNGEERDDKEF